MPPRSTNLWQEGAVFKSLKIIENNIFKEQGKLFSMSLSKLLGLSSEV